MLKTSKLDRIEEHRPLLMSIALRCCEYTTAEDMVQETIFKALKHDAKYGTDEIRVVETWLVSILNNTIVTHYRLKRNQELSLSTSFNRASHDSHEFEIDMRDALNRLPKHYRAVILKRIDGYNDREIAKELGVSPQTIRVRVYRARNLLKGLGKDTHAQRN